MTADSPLFRKYTDFVLYWEGDRSSDPEDGAAACAPYPGAVHTVKGVTYCTFYQLASSLGIPNSYQRFLNLTNEDAAKFMFLFYQDVQGPDFPDVIGLSMLEASWLSGKERAVKHLQAALNAMGANPALVVDGIIGPKTRAAMAAQSNTTDLFYEYWMDRQAYLDWLTTLPAYDQYKDGWNNRIDQFLKKFGPTHSAIGPIGATVAGGLFLFAIALYATTPKARKQRA